MDGAGFVDAEGELGRHLLLPAQRAVEQLNGLLGLHPKPLALHLQHAGGKRHRQAADLASPGRVGRAAAILERVGVAIGLAEQLVQGHDHHGARGMPRPHRGLRGQRVFGLGIGIEQEVAIVFVQPGQQRPLQLGRPRAGFQPVVRIGHVPECAFEPTAVVGPEVALGRAEPGAEIAVAGHQLRDMVPFASQPGLRKILEQGPA